tara:strand:- start:1573 stop:1749 length:177 start_codon:yes stop_codon:yes gene_type:complete
MAEKRIRYGAGGVPYYESVDTPEPKSEMIQEILHENPNKEDKKEAPKKKKKEKDNEKF